MRLRQKPAPTETAKPRPEPLVNGIVRGRKPRGFYSKMSDDEIVAYAKKFMKERGICGRKELQRADEGLYWALLKREKERPRIMERVGFKRKKQAKRDWGIMGDRELVVHARAFMEERGIRGRTELQKADGGLYHALLKRQRERPGIMDKIGFDERYRDWKAIGDSEIVAHARAFIMERRVSGRKELARVDKGLYVALLKRERKRPGIMALVFSNIESAKHTDAVNGVISALESFGDD